MDNEDVKAQVPVVEDVEKLDLKEFYKLVMPSQSIPALGDALQRENNTLGDEEFTRQINKIGSYAELLKRMIDAHTDQTIFIGAALERLKNVNMVGDSYEYKTQNDEDPSDTEFSLKNRVLKIDKSLNGIEVGGHQARMLILAANSNVKKIHLYNSGFNIVVRGPSLVEINLVYNRLSEEMGDYGRMLGAIFYMYSDFKIKSIIWEFVESLVIGSNLNKYDKGNRLRDSVSLLDYQPILLGIGSLMFKNGYDFVSVCTNETCKYTVTETIDLNLLQLTDFSRIPHEQLRAMSTNDVVNPEDLRKYHKALGLADSVVVDRYRIFRKVPSMSSYIKNGAAFNDELAMSIHDIRDPKIVDQYLKYNYSRLFEPWISHVEVIDQETQTVSFKITEREAITLILTELQNSGVREAFTEDMNTFIQNATITNVGYLATPCSSCGMEPTGLNKGFVPFDAQNSFFTMLVMRLIQTS